MVTPSENQHPRDRQSDLPVVASPPGLSDDSHHHRLHKPPVLRRSTIKWLCAGWLLLVVYGTLGPLGVGRKPWLVPVESWNWIPAVHSQTFDSYNDLFTNIAVYLPVGVALTLLIRRRGGPRGLELLPAMFLAVTLSYVTELLQQCMPARCSDRGDLYVDAAAALVGCLIAPRVQRLIRGGHQYAYDNWRERPWLLAAWLMTLITAGLMTLPWDFYWPSLEIEYFRNLDLLDLRRFGTFVLLGFLIAMAMIERHGYGARAVGEAVKRIFIYGVYFEAMQIFLRSHACGLLDISTAFFGGMAGAGVARWLTGMSLEKGGIPTSTRRAFALVLVLGLVGFGLLPGIATAKNAGTTVYDPKFLLLPFQLDFLESFDRVMIAAAEALFLYGSLTMLCLYLRHESGRWVALLLLFGIVSFNELSKILIRDMTADITPALMGLASWMIAVRCWNAFRPKRGTARDSLSARTS